MGYLEALEQAKTGKNADGKNTDDEAIEKIGENLGYMSGFVAKLAELGETGDANKARRLIEDFEYNLKESILYDKDAWAAEFSKYCPKDAAPNLADFAKSKQIFVLPKQNADVAKIPDFQKFETKGFAEGQTDGFTSYQIYAVGNSKLKTDVKLLTKDGKNDFVFDYFKTHTADFKAILTNLSNNNLVNFWRAKMDAIKVSTSQELAENDTFKNQFNEAFFKGNLHAAENKKPETEGKAKPEPILSFELAKEGAYLLEKSKFVIDYRGVGNVPFNFDKAGNVFKALKVNLNGQKNSPEGAIQLRAIDKENAPYLIGNGIEISKNPPQNSTLFKSELIIPHEDKSFYPNFKALGIDEKKVDEALKIGNGSGQLSLSDKDFKKSLKELQNKLMTLASSGTKIENIGAGTEMLNTSTPLTGGTVETPTVPNPKDKGDL